MHLLPEPEAPQADARGYAPTRHVQTLLLDGRRVFLRLWCLVAQPEDVGELRVIVGREHDEVHAAYRVIEDREDAARRALAGGRPMPGVCPKTARRRGRDGVGATG